MNKRSFISLSLAFLFYCELTHATDITSLSTDAIAVSGDSQEINITGSGNIAPGEDNTAITNSSYLNTAITVNTTSESDGINATGNYSSAIDASGGTISSLNITSGTVSAGVNNEFTSESTVILLLGGSNDATTTVNVGNDSGNSGTISNLGYGAAISAYSGTVLFTDLGPAAMDLTINNKATGTISSQSSSKVIVLHDGNAGSSLTLDNAGMISGSSYAIYLTGYDATITNSGTIIGAIYGDKEIDITNTGTITGDIILGSNSGSSLTINGGTVTGAVTMGNSSQTTTFGGGHLTGTIDGAGAVAVNSDATISDNIGSTTAITSLTAALGASATFGGNISASGDVTISGDAIFSNNTNTITANSFITNAGSSLSLSVSDVLQTPITVVGSASISQSTTLKVNFANLVDSGTVITLIDASEASTINVIADAYIDINGMGGNGYGNQTFTTSVVDDALLLTASTATLTLSDSNQNSAYRAIAHDDAATGNLLTLQSYLSNSNNSHNQKLAAIKSAAPQVDNSTNRVAFNTMDITANIVSSRLASLRHPIADVSFDGDNRKSFQVASNLTHSNRSNDFGSYPLFANLKGDKASSLWVQTFGTTINQGNTSVGDGYNANSGGVAIGIDRKISNHTVIGMNTGYSNSRVKENNSGKRTDIDTYQIGLYSGYDAKSYFLNSAIGLTMNQYKSQRYIHAVGDSAQANYGGMGYMARAELGSHYQFANDLILTPSITLTAARNQVRDYDETGAGSLNLHVKNDSANFFEARIGGQLKKTITLKKGTTLYPQISASYGYDFAGNKQKVTSNFIGQTTSFSSTGSNIAQGSLKLGTGMALYTVHDLSFSTLYELEKRNDYISHTGWIKFGVSF